MPYPDLMDFIPNFLFDNTRCVYPKLYVLAWTCLGITWEEIVAIYVQILTVFTGVDTVVFRNVTRRVLSLFRVFIGHISVPVHYSVNVKKLWQLLWSTNLMETL